MSRRLAGLAIALSIAMVTVPLVSVSGVQAVDPCKNDPLGALGDLPHCEVVDLARENAELGCRSTIRDVQESCAQWIRWDGIPRGEVGFYEAKFKDSALSPDGETLVLTGVALADYEDCYCWHLNQIDRLIVAVDVETGDRTWTAVEGTEDVFDGGYEVAFTPSGDRVVVVGKTRDVNGSNDELTISVFDPETWSVESRFTESVDGGLAFQDGMTSSDLTIGPDGDRAYLALNHVQQTHPYDHGALMTVVDLEDPALLWRQNYSPTKYTDRPSGLVLAPDGETLYTLTGEPTSCTGSCVEAPGEAQWNVAWTLHAYDARTGDVQWTTTYDPSTDIDAPYGGLVIDPDGEHLYAAGRTDTDLRDGAPGATVVSFDTATGDEEWQTRLTGTDTYSIATSIALGPNAEQIYVGGYDRTRSDALAASIQADTGQVAWMSTFDRLGDALNGPDYGNTIAPGPGGEQVHLFVKGRPDRLPQTRLVDGSIDLDTVWRDYDTSVVTFDAATGETAWSTSLGTNMGAEGRLSMLAVGLPIPDQSVVVDAPRPGFGPVGLHTTPDGERVLLAGTDLHPNYVGEGHMQMVAASYPADGPTPSLGGDLLPFGRATGN